MYHLAVTQERLGLGNRTFFLCQNQVQPSLQYIAHQLHGLVQTAMIQSDCPQTKEWVMDGYLHSVISLREKWYSCMGSTYGLGGLCYDFPQNGSIVSLSERVGEQLSVFINPNPNPNPYVTCFTADWKNTKKLQNECSYDPKILQKVYKQLLTFLIYIINNCISVSLHNAPNPMSDVS